MEDTAELMDKVKQSYSDVQLETTRLYEKAVHRNDEAEAKMAAAAAELDKLKAIEYDTQEKAFEANKLYECLCNANAEYVTVSKRRRSSVASGLQEEQQQAGEEVQPQQGA